MLKPIKTKKKKHIIRVVLIVALATFMACLPRALDGYLHYREWQAEIYLIRDTILENHRLFIDKPHFPLPEEILATREDRRQAVLDAADWVLRKVPFLNDLEVTLHLPYITAALEDSHTAVDNREVFRHIVPIYFNYYTDGFYFYSYYDDHTTDMAHEHALLGSRLISVNGYTPDEIAAKVQQYSYCENSHWLKNQICASLNSPYILYAIGIIKTPLSFPEYIFEVSGKEVKYIPDTLTQDTPSGQPFYEGDLYQSNFVTAQIIQKPPKILFEHANVAYKFDYQKEIGLLLIDINTFELDYPFSFTWDSYNNLQKFDSVSKV